MDWARTAVCPGGDHHGHVAAATALVLVSTVLVLAVGTAATACRCGWCTCCVRSHKQQCRTAAFVDLVLAVSVFAAGAASSVAYRDWYASTVVFAAVSCVALVAAFTASLLSAATFFRTCCCPRKHVPLTQSDGDYDVGDDGAIRIQIPLGDSAIAMSARVPKNE